MFIELHDLMDDEPILVNTANIFEVHGLNDEFSVVRSIAGRSSSIEVSESILKSVPYLLLWTRLSALKATKAWMNPTFRATTNGRTS